MDFGSGIRLSNSIYLVLEVARKECKGKKNMSMTIDPFPIGQQYNIAQGAVFDYAPAPFLLTSLCSTAGNTSKG